MHRSGDMADRSADRACWAALAAVIIVTAAPAAAHAQAAPPPAAPPAAPPPANGPTAQDDVVLLEADTVTDDQQTGLITADGDVEAHYQGRTLRADRVIYDVNGGAIHAIGNVQIANADGSVQYANEVETDQGLNVGLATELRARFGTDGTLAARAAIRHSPTKNELRNVIYTSCPVCSDGSRAPTWAFRARRAIQDQNHKTISYEGAVLEVTGVPVLYLPYFGHPDPTAGRHSGFLIPDAGRNSRLGAFYEQGYYWDISPYQDMTLGVRVHEQVNPLVGLQYRKRFYSGEVQFDGTITQEQLFGSNGIKFGDEATRSSMFAVGRFQINDYWKWGFGAERTSDDTYLRRYDISGAGEVRGPYLGDSHRLISQLYAIGENDNSYSSIALVSFQGLRTQDTSNLLPLILPLAETDHVYTDPLLHGQVHVSASTASLQRDDDASTTTFEGNDARASVGVSWRKDTIFGPGLVLSPFAQVREDLFHVQTASDHYETFSRSLGLAGAEVSWPFLRPGQDVDLIVEPVAMAGWANEGNDPRIVNEDSLNFELDDSNLFRPDAAPNYDLWEPGGRVALGVRATARTHDGHEASLLFGRRWRQEAAPGFTDQNNLNGRATDWVGAVNANLGPALGADVTFRLADDTLKVQRIDADVRSVIGRITANVRYYRVDHDLVIPGDPSSQLSGAISARLFAGWRAQYGVVRDLDSDTNLQQQLSAIYEDDCTFLQIAYTRSETRQGVLGPSEGIQIRVGLKSLGVLGGGE